MKQNSFEFFDKYERTDSKSKILNDRKFVCAFQ